MRGGWAGAGLIMVLVLFPAAALAQGGPPMITDDPDTPGPGYWEINVVTLLEKSRLERRLEGPLADINYGVGRRIQLKFEMPWLSVRETGMPVQAGPGNALLGVKWRFLGQEGQRIAWSIYPQLEINTGRSMARQGFLDEGPAFFMPTELTFQKGGFEINGEVGRTFVKNGDDGWSFGVSTEAELHSRFELLGEVHGDRSGTAPTELIVNAGARQQITSRVTFMVAVGRSVHGARDERLQLRLDVGLQFNLPRRYTFNHSTSPRQVARPL
jgi:hypothetical protein